MQDGGTNEASNLVTACRRCNSSKQNLTIRVWFQRLREKGIDTNKVGARARRLMAKDLKPYRIEAKRLISERKHGSKKASTPHLPDLP